MVYLALALAGASLLLSGWLFTVVRSQSDQLEAQDVILAKHSEAMRGYKKHIERLYDEIDLLASEGPQPAPKNQPEPVIVKADLSNQRELNDSLPLRGHTLIVGQSGSGKSNLLMAQIIRRLKDGQLLHCIDTKDEIEPIFGREVQCVPTSMAKQKFEEMLRIARERRQLFAQTSQLRGQPVRDFGEYYKVTGTRLPVVTLICEELIVLMGEVDEDLLVKLLVIGRSAGVFVVAPSQYLKADILSRKGSVNFNTCVFLGKFDSIAAGLLFGNLEKEEARALREFLGPPGKGAVMEQGQLRTATFPEVTDSYLLPFFGAGELVAEERDEPTQQQDENDDDPDWWDEEPA